MKTYKCFFGFHDYEYSATRCYKTYGDEYTTVVSVCQNCEKLNQQELRGHFRLSSEEKKIESVQICKEVEKILREE